MKVAKEETLDDVLNSTNQVEKTELGEVFDNLDNDKVDPNTKFSKLDFNTRLSNTEINNIMIFEELRSLGLMPQEATLTIQKKRMNISRDGLGRKEKVEISTAGHEASVNGKSGGFLSKMFQQRQQ